jgi:lipopolysaccharide export LptBFGC system permease protein LptF
MRAPGTRLRAFALRICRSETMERLIDPVIGLAATTLFCSYFVLYPFYGLVGDGAISPVMVAWTPNVVALMVTVACSAGVRRHRENA